MNRAKLVSQLLDDEGLRLKPYKCTAGKTTIGVGRNLDDVGISKAEAMLMLETDIDNCARNLDRELPWWRDLDDARRNVLLNMAFNLGIAGSLAPVQAYAEFCARQCEYKAYSLPR